MSHIRKTQAKLLNRVHRLRGQIEAIERAVEKDQDCAEVLHLVAAVRGAIGGLMVEVLEDHIRNHVIDPEHELDAKKAEGAADLIDVVRSYLK